MGVYDRQRTTAARLIAAKGQSVTWRRRSASGGTAAKPAASVIEEKTVTMVFLPPKRETFLSYLAQMTNTDVPASGVHAIMANVDFEPTLIDTVVRDGKEMMIEPKNGIERVDPNGEGGIIYMLRFVR